MARQQEETMHVSTGNWYFTILLSAIPVVNIIMAIVWVCGGKTPSKRHYGAALLIFHIILLVLTFISLVSFGPQTLKAVENINAWLHKVLGAA
ncbi:MAG: hypothetical protein ACOYI8_00390 [Christensenellales bacterium]|jgi:hypothetical protein